jgi:hypothetical protein
MVKVVEGFCRLYCMCLGCERILKTEQFILNYVGRSCRYYMLNVPVRKRSVFGLLPLSLQDICKCRSYLSYEGVLLLLNAIVLNFKVNFDLRSINPNSDPIAGFALGFCTDHSCLDMVD